MKLFLAAFAALPLLAVDAGLLNYMDPSATELAGVYVDRAANSPLGLFVERQKLITVPGFDPRRDLKELVVSDGLVVARGVFPASLRLKPRESYKGVDLYAHRPNSGWLAFPEPTIAIFGDKSLVMAAIDRRGSTSVLDALLAGKIQTASARYDVWFAAKGGSKMNLGRSPIKGDAFQVVSGGATLGDTVQINAEAVMRSEQDAQSVAGLLKVFSGMTQQRPDALSLVRNADARVEGSTVVFSTWATEAELERLFGLQRRTASIR